MHDAFGRLVAELDELGPRGGSLPCTPDWRLRDLLAVRAWWTDSVLEWIAAGKRGEVPVTPADGFRWRETPRLNAEIVRRARRVSFRELRKRLERGFRRVQLAIDRLDDRELLAVGVFEWAGRYPLARWLALNTARQYETARTLIRRARQLSTQRRT